MEDLLYEAESVRRFVGVRCREPLPDESTILHFPPLAGEASPWAGVVCGDQRASGGTGGAVTGGNDRGRDHHSGAESTKNRSGERDAEMLQVKKGNQYYFGMKLHIGAARPRGWCTALQRRRQRARRDASAPAAAR